MMDYLPARLVRASDRWYFIYYQTDPITLKRRRHRETFQIGRIPIEERLPIAREVIAEINARLPYGYPYDQDFHAQATGYTIPQAIEYVLNMNTDLRPASIISYKSSARKFLAFIDSISLSKAPISSVNKKIAIAYSDHLTKKGLSGRSHNNDINEMKRVFNILQSRDIIASNPWKHVPRRAQAQKQRRALSPEEVKIVLDYLKTEDRSTYLSVLLLYYCFIRPNEQRYIQRRQIDLNKSTIEIKGEFAKNHKTAFVTIPDELAAELVSLGVDNLKPDAYLLGKTDRIGNTKPISKSRISNRYRDHIKALYQEGALASIDGHSLYSWKDTMAAALGRSGINAIGLKDQLRHHSIDEAETYIGSLREANDFIQRNHRIGK